MHCNCRCFGCKPVPCLRQPRISHCQKRQDRCFARTPRGPRCWWKMRECGTCELIFLENPGNEGCPACKRTPLIMNRKA